MIRFSALSFRPVAIINLIFSAVDLILFDGRRCFPTRQAIPVRVFHFLGEAAETLIVHDDGSEIRAGRAAGHQQRQQRRNQSKKAGF